MNVKSHSNKYVLINLSSMVTRWIIKISMILLNLPIANKPRTKKMYVFHGCVTVVFRVMAPSSFVGGYKISGELTPFIFRGKSKQPVLWKQRKLSYETTWRLNRENSSFCFWIGMSQDCSVFSLMALNRPKSRERWSLIISLPLQF
jgi:hypothetical protein